MATKFPKGFMWGVSTASHQVEGDTYNQWTAWELKNAQRLASTAKTWLVELKRYGLKTNWEAIAEQASRPENYISGSAVGHFTHYAEDFALLKSLHMDAFRFSIEWSRLEPHRGEWDQAAVDHYRAYIAKLRAMDIEPIMTLWHWTVPVWFDELGGFARRRNLKYFTDFVSKVVEEFGDDIRYMLVLNEPNVYCLMSYLVGHWPPEHMNVLETVRVYRNLAAAHSRSYDIIKAANPSIQVSTAMNLSKSYAVNPHNPINRVVVWFQDYLWNWWFLNAVKRRQDFVGVNFYTTLFLDWRWRPKVPPGPVNDVGWYMKPSAIYDVIVESWKRYKLPIIVTENGLADANDSKRQWWVEQTLHALERALAHGVIIKGYLHWSLIDNFEWSLGWWPKYGLVSVDRATMKRTVRPSARWFAEQIRHFRRISE